MSISIHTHRGMMLIKVSIVPKGFKDFDFGLEIIEPSPIPYPGLLLAIAYLCGGWSDSYYHENYMFATEAQREHFLMCLGLLGIKRVQYWRLSDIPF